MNEWTDGRTNERILGDLIVEYDHEAGNWKTIFWFGLGNENVKCMSRGCLGKGRLQS